MASLPRISGAASSLIAVACSELRRDLALLVDARWDEPLRRRAGELSLALADLFRRQGLKELQPHLNAVTNLTRISRTQALPLLPELAEKLDTLMREVERLLPKRRV